MLYLVGGPGNAERVDVSDLFALRLAQKGLHVDYVIFDNRPGPAWQKREWRGASAYGVGLSNRGGLSGAIQNKLREIRADLSTTLLVLTGDHDIVQIRDKFVVAVLALAAARLRRKKFTYWLSYPFAECRVDDAKAGRAKVPWISYAGGKAASWLLYRLIMPYADHVFVQSRQMQIDVAAQGIEQGKTTPVPMGVNEKLFDIQAPTIAQRTILYLGTLARVRQLDMLLHALKLLVVRYPDAKLVFVGDGDNPEDRASLEQESRSLGLTDSVEFTGFLPMEEALARTSSAAVCVSPFYPTFVLLSTSPTKLIEYMALGRPVVASEHPEQSEIISESGAGYCVPWDPAAYAEAFAKLFDDPAAAEAMGERGRDYVRSRRVYQLIARDVAEIYETMLETKKAR
jgi:glycosyltransferase involved in cell wall biosynthesis